VDIASRSDREISDSSGSFQRTEGNSVGLRSHLRDVSAGRKRSRRSVVEFARETRENRENERCSAEAERRKMVESRMPRWFSSLRVPAHPSRRRDPRVSPTVSARPPISTARRRRHKVALPTARRDVRPAITRNRLASPTRVGIGTLFPKETHSPDISSLMRA